MALAEDVTNIPTDIYGWSGLPKEHRESLLSSIMPQLTAGATGLPSTITSGFDKARGTLGQLGEFWKGSPGVVTPYMESAQRGFKGATEGAFQGVLNKLAGRNVLGSQVTSDTLANLGAQLNQQQFGGLADMALQTQLRSQEGQADVLGKEAAVDIAETETLSNVPGVLAQIAGLGKASEQPWQPYQSFMNLIQTMM